MHRLSYKLLLLLTILATIAGLVSMIPAQGASYDSVMGYKALCTFAPASVFFCFLVAGLSCFIRSTFIKDQSGSPQERFKRHGKSLIPLTLILILALGSTVWFNQVKKQYTDGVSSATMEETK